MNIKMNGKNNVEVWGGMECTINRIGNTYVDQLELAGHYTRKNDLELLPSLGIRALRYPILWEKYQPVKNEEIDFGSLPANLLKLQQQNIEPIAGLLHHGSGPAFTNLLDDNFPFMFAEFAAKVARRFTFVEYFTPINEPLTTARFSGLYGHWYPHHCNEFSFLKMLLNQLKGVVLAMHEIRKIIPAAKLIQTEDLAKVFSTPVMKYQADFENIRRWLTFDILSGHLTIEHPFWKYIIDTGIPVSMLDFFQKNPCTPDILGVNYYITSERYLEENVKKYPFEMKDRNNFDLYDDTEAVRVEINKKTGLKERLKEIWFKYRLPIAVTEIHINCHREEQMRWFYEAWKDCVDLRNNGVDIRAITAWSLFGSFGWDRLLTGEQFKYETGVFDISSGKLRETSLAGLIRNISINNNYNHPVLNEPGWWKRSVRFTVSNNKQEEYLNSEDLIFIISKRGSLGKVFAKHCNERAISYLSLARNDFDICNPDQMNSMIKLYKPWAIINCAGFVNVDLAETEIHNCLELNTKGVINLAKVCRDNKIKLVTFSSDMVFNGTKKSEYTEEDIPDPLNIYGISKLLAEHFVLTKYPETLFIRTSSFFSPHDEYNFLSVAFKEISTGRKFVAANDIIISPTYLPHLVNKSLDLMLDDEKGIIHLTNKGAMSWAQFARISAELAGLDTDFIVKKNISHLNLKAQRPENSALLSVKGEFLPTIYDGIHDFVKEYKQTRFKSSESILVK